MKVQLLSVNKKNYDSVFFTGERHIHYCNTIQNTHLFKKSGIASGVTLLLGEMKSHNPSYVSYAFDLRFLISY